MDGVFSGEGAPPQIEGGADSLGETAERGGLVTARGTAEGLVLRLDGRVEPASLKQALLEFLNSRRGFLGGNEVSLEWVGKKPEDSFLSEVTEVLTSDFKISVRSSRLRETHKLSNEGFKFEEESQPLVREISLAKDSKTAEVDHKPLGLFSGVDDLPFAAQAGGDAARAEKNESVSESFLWDDPDARIIYATLRSGQKIETEHSLVLFGDVNSGAEVVAGGDIAVMGTLRGVAHAGAYDETGGGRFIFALNLQPTQLRIGSIISRGSNEGLKGPEIARVDANMIVVEGYQTKNIALRRRG